MRWLDTLRIWEYDWIPRVGGCLILASFGTELYFQPYLGKWSKLIQVSYEIDLWRTYIQTAAWNNGANNNMAFYHETVLNTMPLFFGKTIKITSFISFKFHGTYHGKMHFQISLIAPRSTQEMERTMCSCTSGYASLVSSQECILAWPWKRCAGLRWTPTAAVYMLSCSSQGILIYWYDMFFHLWYHYWYHMYVYIYIYRSRMNDDECTFCTQLIDWTSKASRSHLVNLCDSLLKLFSMATTGAPFSTGLHQLAQQCAARTNAAALWWRAHSGVGTTVSRCFSRIDQRVERTPKARPL